MSTRELFRSENLPVFQNKMFDSEIAACSCPTGDLVLVQDMGTGLVFNEAFDANLVDYDDSYQNEQACSDTFRQHIEAVTKIIDRHCFGKTILEIGCGKGFFCTTPTRSGLQGHGGRSCLRRQQSSCYQSIIWSRARIDWRCSGVATRIRARLEALGFLVQNR